MSSRKKIIGVIIVTILILALGMSVGDNDPKIRTSYQVLDDARLGVNIEGVEEGDIIDLYCPDDDKVGSTTIDSEDMTKRLVGVIQAETEVTMTDEGNPSQGDYTLVVDDSSTEDPIYEEVLTFEGPDIQITDADLGTEYDDDSDTWSITDLELKVDNHGDLSIFAVEADLIIGDEAESVGFNEELLPGETAEIKENISIDIETGTHPIDIELYSFDDEIASYGAEVTIGE